jgi:hypothetical protein
MDKLILIILCVVLFVFSYDQAGRAHKRNSDKIWLWGGICSFCLLIAVLLYKVKS